MHIEPGYDRHQGLLYSSGIATLRESLALSGGGPSSCQLCARSDTQGRWLSRRRLSTESPSARRSGEPGRADSAVIRAAAPLVRRLRALEGEDEQDYSADDGQESDEQPPSAVPGVVETPGGDREIRQQSASPATP